MPTLVTRLVVIVLILVLTACGAPAPIDDDPPNDDGNGNGAPSAPSSPTLTLTATAVKTFVFAWETIDGATEYRLLEDPNGSSDLQPIATVASSETRYALEVFLPGRINARYRLQACNDLGCGDSDVVTVAGTLVGAIGYVKASNTAAGDEFGFRIALSNDGATLAIGAPFEDGGSTGIDGDPDRDDAADSGAVYVFARTGIGTWSIDAYVKASNVDANDWFGWRVALSGDGSTLAVSAPGEASDAAGINGDETRNAIFRAGAVYVFERAEGVWTQQAYVKASNPFDQAWFGSSVALSGDGNTLAVGSLGESSAATGIDGDQTPDMATSFFSGAAYVFTRDAGTWRQQAYVKASNTAGMGAFGSSVALSATGDTLAVGAFGERSSATGIDGDQSDTSAIRAGAVYVFARSRGGWSQQAYVKASNSDADDRFGSSVALSGDGSTLAVGAAWEASDATGINGDQRSNAASEAGAVYVFRRGRDGWTQQAYVKASNARAGDRFGSSVTLSGDGAILAVGAPLEDGTATGIGGDQGQRNAIDSGAVYLFERASTGTWTQRAYVKSSNTRADHGFGYSLALAGDGSALAVGATGDDSVGDPADDSAPAAGAVYLF